MITIKYSSSTGGFYASDIEYPEIPVDAVEISAGRHRELLEGQSKGLRITAAEDGYPKLVDPLDLMSPEERLLQAKAAKQFEIEQACEQLLSRGLEHKGRRYASDQATQAKLLMAQQMAGMTQEPYPVLDLEGNAHALTAEQLTELLKTIASQYRQATQHAQALCEKLAAAQTQEAITSIEPKFEF